MCVQNLDMFSIQCAMLKIMQNKEKPLKESVCPNICLGLCVRVCGQLVFGVFYQCFYTHTREKNTSGVALMVS